jgi:hypothetical protein
MRCAYASQPTCTGAGAAAEAAYCVPAEPAMPSFDIVSEVNQVEVRNAVDQCNKEVTNRFDC